MADASSEGVTLDTPSTEPSTQPSDEATADAMADATPDVMADATPEMSAEPGTESALIDNGVMPADQLATGNPDAQIDPTDAVADQNTVVINEPPMQPEVATNDVAITITAPAASDDTRAQFDSSVASIDDVGGLPPLSSNSNGSSIAKPGSGTAVGAGEDPRFLAEARFVAGRNAQSHNKLQEAADLYAEALRFNPNFADAAYHLGVVNSLLQKYDRAVNNFWDYVRLTNQSAAAYANLGYAYELSGRTTEAETAYKRGIAQDPTQELCRVNYGLMLARAGREEEALAQLTVALSPADAHYNVGSIYELQGKKQQAREEYNKALQLDPGMWSAQRGSRRWMRGTASSIRRG